MPLEIKYCERPIECIEYTDKDGDRLAVNKASSRTKIIIAFETKLNNKALYTTLSIEDFKEWAAAVYKFSLEV